MNSIIKKNYQQILERVQHQKDVEEKYNSHTINIVFLWNVNLESYFHDIEINNQTTMVVYRNMSRSRRDVPFETALQRMNKNDFLEILWNSIQIRVSSKMMVLLHTDLNPRQVTFPIPPHKKIFIKNFKKTIHVTLSKRWSRYIFAHLISVHPVLRHNLSYLENHNPCSGRKKEIVWLCMDNINAKIILTIKEKGNNNISVKFADDYSVHVKSYHYDYVNRAIAYMRRVFMIYEDMFDKINMIYDIDAKIDIIPNTNSIKYLKSVYPDFFISGYSRECPNLPIVITENETNKYESYLEYPSGSGRYFAAPPGSYVSIKKNRLSNSKQYPFLVNCYPTDHKNRLKSQYVKYYNPSQYKESLVSLSSKTSVPTNLLIGGVERIQLSYNTIYSILEWIFGKTTENFQMQLCRQSFWCDIDIKFDPDDHRLYRLYEYLFKTNIFLLQINNSHLAHVILPPHRDEYIWNPTYDRSVIIVREIKGAYGMRDNVYSILSSSDNQYVFANDHPLSKSVIDTKLSCTVRGSNINITDFVAQYINENGKCTLLKRDDGSVVSTYCEPQALNTFEDILDTDISQHIQKAYELGSINKTQFRHLSDYATRITERYFENR